MTDKFGVGQADKRAAEERTAQVGAENKAAEQQRTEQAGQAPRSAADKVAQADVSTDSDVVVNPYPAYEEMSLDELRSLAKSRNVEINRDVEKSHLVGLLRAEADGPAPEFDLMPLDRVRKAAGEKGVDMDEEFEVAHLITELRAADTHTG